MEEDSQLIGVHLIVGGRSGTKTCLGIAVVPKKEDMSLNSLRTVLYCQVTTLPENFTFCTQQGWKINKNLEGSVLVKQVISIEGAVFIQRQFDKPQIGIRHKSGENLGMIFADLNSSLSDVRTCIHSQMTGSTLTSHNYWFLTHNDWPISCKQENDLTVIDLMEDSCLKVDVQTFVTPTLSPMSPSPQPRKKIKGSRHLSFRTSKDLGRKEIADSSMTEDKQILISYVRADAAHHALALKQELSSLGYSVYLDVHEITSGVDWQDSLNNAVTNCEVFVPLVTSKYGETLWTNREVKLADVLGKYIIPVSFITDWPPPCLAIQFATTQYINWRHPLNSDEIQYVSQWDTQDLKYVAQQIAEKVQKFTETDKDFPSLAKRKTVVKSCPCVDVSNPQATVENRDGHPLIVICVHPTQGAFGAEMKEWLEGHDFEVWCSTQLSIEYPDSIKDLENGIKPGTKEIRNRQIFQEHADEAGVIILILSEQFVLSRTCQQQVFYCEQRKKLVPLSYGDFVIPGWLSVLTGQHILMNANIYKNQLLKRIQKLLVSTHIDKESNIKDKEIELQKAVSNGLSVYVTGGSVLENEKTENICRSVGTHLASIDSIVLGIRGDDCDVPDHVAQSFYQETQRLWKTNQVLQVLRQGEEPRKRYGQIIHIEGSNETYLTAVSNVFDILIIIKGNAEQEDIYDKFVWNEKLVITILCNTNDSVKLTQKPQEILQSDWSIFTDVTSSPEQIGKTIKKVVLEYLQNRDSVKLEQDSVHSSSPNTQLRKMNTILLKEKK